jgi:N-carbamoyl-L-amino-acid hydrolase
MQPHRVITDLRQLAALTGTAEGAQRVAWGPVWRQAREWYTTHARALGIEPRIDAAGNTWYTLAGEREETVIVGGHLDSVPNGGWLDGALGVMAGLEALRMYHGQRPPVTLAVVDWADEEGACSDRRPPAAR